MDAAKRGARKDSGKKKRGLHQHFPTDTSKSSLLHQAYLKECAMQRERTPEMDYIDRPRIHRSEHETRIHKLSHHDQQPTRSNSDAMADMGKKGDR
jgi:hypothetical protein